MHTMPRFNWALVVLAVAGSAVRATAQEVPAGESRVVFRIHPTGDAGDERRMLGVLERYLKPKMVDAPAGASVYELIRNECGVAKEVHVESFRRLNPGITGMVLGDSATVALPPCPLWDLDAETVVGPGGSVASATELETGSSGPRTLAAVAARNQQIRGLRALFDQAAPALEGKTVQLPYAVLPTSFELKEEHAAAAPAVVAAIAAVPGAITVGLDEGGADLVKEVRDDPGADARECVGPAAGQAWPFSTPGLLDALRRNAELRRRMTPAVPDPGVTMVGIADTGIERGETRLPLYVNPLEEGGDPGEDDDGNKFLDDVIGVHLPGRRGPPDIEFEYDRRGHGTSVAGLAVGGAGSPELMREVEKRMRLSILSLVERETFPATDDTGPRHRFRYPEGAIAQALQYTPNGTHISILNFSIESPQAMENFAAAASAASKLMVIAAGNGASDLDATPTYPAYYVRSNRHNILTVTAHNALTPEQRRELRQTREPAEDEVLPRFSNRGAQTVDIAAPGCMVESIALNGARGTFTGTSYAAPLVSFTAALLMSEGIRSVERTKSRILATVDFIPSLEMNSSGLLNIEKALAIYEDVVELRSGEVLRGRIVGPENFQFAGKEVAWKQVLKVVPSHPVGTSYAVTLFRRGPRDEVLRYAQQTRLTEIRFLDWSTGVTRIIPMADLLDLMTAAPEFRNRTLRP